MNAEVGSRLSLLDTVTAPRGAAAIGLSVFFGGCVGGYWRGGRWIETTWGDKISARLREPGMIDKKMVRYACAVCGKETRGFKCRADRPHYCSNRCRYVADTNHPDPYLARARSLASGIRLGAGKREVIANLLRGAIDKPCAYCGKIVTFKNAQIDHKTPVTGLRNLPIRFHLDRIENLQAICRRCNCAKGEMSDEKYRKLLAFIRSDRDIYRAVWRRLSMSGYGWKSVKKKAASAGSS